MYKKIVLSNERYGITGTFFVDKNIYEKHYAMHPIRPEEALQNELSICYGYGVPVNDEMVEKVIKDEFDVANNLPKIINEARNIYSRITREMI